MERLSSWVCGEWREGQGSMSVLVNPTTEALVAETSTQGLDPFGAGIRPK